MTSEPAALVISPWLEGWFMPSLLAAAGLRCDVVSGCAGFRHSRHATRLGCVQAANSLATTAMDFWRQHGPYQWVIAMSDSLLGELAQRALLDASYGSLLPLSSQAPREHLYSKIGLCRVLEAAGVPIPGWRVASDREMTLRFAAELGWPLMLKQDGSAGGRGVYACVDAADLDRAVERLAGRSFLMQEWVHGRIFSVEALFFQGDLRSFALSRMEAFEGRHAPSIHRLYGLTLDVIPDLRSHLMEMGRALGLHGFANISLVHDGGKGPPRFFECDARPNAWLHLDHAFGGDFAGALRVASTGQVDRELPAPMAAYQDLPRQIVAPFRRRCEGGLDQPESWPYQPPDDDPTFLDFVWSSGQLTRGAPHPFLDSGPPISSQ